MSGQSDMPLASKDDSLTPKQHRGIHALLSEPTLVRAAAKCGVHEHTLRRWLKQPEFRATFSRACARCLDGTITQIAESLVAVLPAPRRLCRAERSAHARRRK